MSIFGKNSTSPPEKGAPGLETKAARLGPQVRIQGELAGDEDILLEGRVDGRVRVSRSFRVGPQGEVSGDIHAHVVFIAGKVRGDVNATERVELLPTGSLEGNIRAPKIVIAEGAQFKGSVDMAGSTGPAADPGEGGAPE